MAETFPNLIPNYLNPKLPDYLKNTQQFDTTQFYQLNYQTIEIGLSFTVQYQKLQLTEVTSIKNFYNLVKHKSFLLPTDFFKRFPLVLKTQFLKFQFWKFEGTIQETPFIINKSRKVSDLEFTIKNVLS